MRRTTLQIPYPVLRWVERALETDLDGVPVLVSGAETTLCDASGVPALAVDGCVVLGRDWWWIADPCRQLEILVHEFAHAAQQRAGRRGRARGTEAEGEAEASVCTAAVMRGRRLRPRVALDPSRPAFWGEAGHYYTVYFVLMAAGASNAQAMRAAFHCQMSDEIADLDAAEQGTHIAMKFGMHGARLGFNTTTRVGAAAANASLRLLHPRGSVSKTRDMLARGSDVYDGRHLTPYDKDLYGTYVTAPHKYRYGFGGFDREVFAAVKVQMGLHALTGGDAEAETAKRVRIAMAMDPATGPGFGLALHALGDSFAHRDGLRMYPPPLGHLMHWHEPDELGPRRAELYERYVRLLHGVAQRIFTAPRRPPGAKGPPLNAWDTLDILARRTGFRRANAGEAAQIAAIRAAAAGELGSPMHRYAPENSDSKNHRYLGTGKLPVDVSRADFDAAMRYAELWSRGAGSPVPVDDQALLAPYRVKTFDGWPALPKAK